MNKTANIIIPLSLSVFLAVASYTVSVWSTQQPEDAPQVDPYAGTVYIHTHPETFGSSVVIPSVFVTREMVDIASGLPVRIVGVSFSTTDDSVLFARVVPSGSAEAIIGYHQVDGVNKAYRISPKPGRSWGMVMDDEDAQVEWVEVHGRG